MDEKKINGNEENIIWEETKQEFELEKQELESKKLDLIKKTPKNELWKIEDELEEIDSRLEEIDSNLKEIDKTINEQEWDGANNKYVNKEAKTEKKEQEDLIEKVLNEQNMDENILDDDYLKIEENDENIIDVDYVEFEKDRNEKLSERAVRLAKEYAYAQGQNVKASAKLMAYNAKEGIKEKIDDAKTAVKIGILNSPPVKFVRGIKRMSRKIFKGFKTAGNIAIGVGALTAEAVGNAKDTIQRASIQSITDLVNSGRDKANSVLDRLEYKVIDKQLETLLKQHILQQEKFDGR